VTPARFAVVKDRLCAIASASAGLELEELLSAIAQTRSAAALLSREEYKQFEEAEPQLRELERLAKAARHLRDEVHRQLSRRETLPAPAARSA
jgi:hypothetical protein